MSDNAKNEFPCGEVTESDLVALPKAQLIKFLLSQDLTVDTIGGIKSALQRTPKMRLIKLAIDLGFAPEHYQKIQGDQRKQAIRRKMRQAEKLLRELKTLIEGTEFVQMALPLVNRLQAVVADPDRETEVIQ